MIINKVPLWSMAVVGVAGQEIAVVVLEPGSQDTYDAVRTRMRTAGCLRISGAEWSRAAWPHAPGLGVHVAGGAFTKVTTPKSTIHAADALPVTERWHEAARDRGRVLFALVPPDTLTAVLGDDGAGTDGAGAPLSDAYGNVLAELAPTRRLIGGLATLTTA